MYVASEIESDGFLIDREPEETPLEVVSVTNEYVTLMVVEDAEETDDLEMIGKYGLEGPDGYWFIDNESPSDNQVRVVKGFYGNFSVGDRVRIDKYSYPAPEKLGLESVDIEGPLGMLRLWQIAPSGSNSGDAAATGATWVIGVHGRDATPSEPLRILLPLSEIGYTGLSITYRNDPGNMEDPSGYYLYGRTEWQDLRAAVLYAQESGAEAIVLVGYSMGGAIVAAFMENAPEAISVKGIIMDSPALNFEAVIDAAAVRRNIPSVVSWAGKIGTGLVYGLDLKPLDYLSRADEWNTPILLFHGGEDMKVPTSISRTAVELRPDIISYIETPEATHVASWNVDPERYEAEVKRFVQGLE